MMNYQEFRDEVKKNIGMYLNTSGMENAKQSEFKRIRKILEKAKYKGSFSVPYKKGEK